MLKFFFNIPILCNDPEVLPSTCDKGKLFAKIFSDYSDLFNSVVFLPSLQELPKIVNKVITDVDSHRASCTDLLH